MLASELVEIFAIHSAVLRLRTRVALARIATMAAPSQSQVDTYSRGGKSEDAASYAGTIGEADHIQPADRNVLRTSSDFLSKGRSLGNWSIHDLHLHRLPLKHRARDNTSFETLEKVRDVRMLSMFVRRIMVTSIGAFTASWHRPALWLRSGWIVRTPGSKHSIK